MFILRIRSRQDFEKVYKNKDEVYCTSSIILYRNKTDKKYISKTNKDFVRIGFTVSKKISKKAVERNFTKRRLREAFNKVQKNILENHMDYVIVARKNILDIGFLDLISDIEKCLLKKSEKFKKLY